MQKAQKEVTANEAYAQEVTRILTAMGALQAKCREFEAVVDKGDRACIDWGKITDVTWARLQLEDVQHRLNGTGQYAQAERMAV